MTEGQRWRKDADKVPQDTMRRMAATGRGMAFRETSGNNTGAALGVSNSSRETAPASAVIGLHRCGPASVLTALLLFFHLQCFRGGTGPQWQNKAFYCWFCMKYSCKCSKC